MKFYSKTLEKPKINMSTPIKTKYELIMDQLRKDGKVKTYTGEEDLAIIAELNKGMDEFLYMQKLNETASVQESMHIVLNA